MHEHVRRPPGQRPQQSRRRCPRRHRAGRPARPPARPPRPRTRRPSTATAAPTPGRRAASAPDARRVTSWSAGWPRCRPAACRARRAPAGAPSRRRRASSSSGTPCPCQARSAAASSRASSCGNTILSTTSRPSRSRPGAVQPDAPASNGRPRTSPQRCAERVTRSGSRDSHAAPSGVRPTPSRTGRSGTVRRRFRRVPTVRSLAGSRPAVCDPLRDRCTRRRSAPGG